MQVLTTGGFLSWIYCQKLSQIKIAQDLSILPKTSYPVAQTIEKLRLVMPTGLPGLADGGILGHGWS